MEFNRINTYIDVNSGWTYVDPGASNQAAGEIVVIANDDFSSIATPDSVYVDITLVSDDVSFDGSPTLNFGNVIQTTAETIKIDILRTNPDGLSIENINLNTTEDDITGSIAVDVRVYMKNLTGEYVFDETETRTIAKVNALPDLWSYSIECPSSANTGMNINIDNPVKSTASSPGFYANYYLSYDTTVTRNEIFIGQRYIPEYSIDSLSDSNSVTIPNGITEGKYYLGMFVDQANAVKETNATNNTLVAANQISITKARDLTLTAFDGPTTGVCGNAISLNNTVKNLGTGTATGVNIKYYLSADSTIATTDTYLGQRTVSSLAGGASSVATTSVTIPSTVTAGSCYLGAYVDPTNVVKETIETNNTKLDTVKITIK